MRRMIRGKVTVELPYSEKFLMIYMPIQDPESENGMPYLRPRASMEWHLEDEQRPKNALCGMPLDGTHKSVSPALAMLGKACGDCKTIVKAYLDDAEMLDTRENRLNTLVKSDMIFRTRVTRVLPADMFVRNLTGNETGKKKVKKK